MSSENFLAISAISDIFKPLNGKTGSKLILNEKNQ
jgi:hypothetical protein